MPVNIDEGLKGKRIRLVFTDDPYTKLRAGDEGTVLRRFTSTDSQGRVIQDVIDVQWDSGSTLSLVVGKDSYEIIQ